MQSCSILCFEQFYLLENGYINAPHMEQPPFWSILWEYFKSKLLEIDFVVAYL